MGRPLKNADNPLARLRKQLTSPGCNQMTRKDLADQTGIPEMTLRAIELGRFEITSDVAMKIAYRYGVHPRSLRKGEDPLLDFEGRPFTKDSRARMESIANDESRLEARQELYQAAVQAALDKGIGKLIEYSFDQWLLKTCKTFGLGTVLAERLTERLEFFDSKWIPSDFRPMNPRLAAEWKAYEEQIHEEQWRVYESGWLQQLFPHDPAYTESESLAIEEYRLYRCRSEARFRVVRQRKARREADEAQRKATDERKRSATQGSKRPLTTRKAA